jgi:hypothetical protein
MADAYLRNHVHVPDDLEAYEDLIMFREVDGAFPFMFTEMGFVYHYADLRAGVLEITLERKIRAGSKSREVVHATARYAYASHEDPDEVLRRSVPVFLREVVARDVMIRNASADAVDYATSPHNRRNYAPGREHDETAPGCVYVMGDLGVRVELVPTDFDAEQKRTSFAVTVVWPRENRAWTRNLGYYTDLSSEARERIRDGFVAYAHVLIHDVLNKNDARWRYVRACCAIHIDLNDQELIDAFTAL